MVFHPSLYCEFIGECFLLWDKYNLSESVASVFIKTICIKGTPDCYKEWSDYPLCHKNRLNASLKTFQPRHKRTSGCHVNDSLFNTGESSVKFSLVVEALKGGWC